MSRPIEFDVVIVGAGPAGTSTAIWSRRVGLRVAILERSPFPRFKVGEALHPGVEVILGQLGVAERVLRQTLVRYDGVWMELGQSRTFVSFGSDSRGRWRGLQVDRARFDQVLCDRAEDLGTVVLQPCHVHDVRRDGANMLINCDQGQLRSRVVVDGTGSQRFIATQMGSESIRCSPPIVARYGYRAGKAPRLSNRPVFTIKRSGWQWIARVRPGIYQWINTYWESDRPNCDEIPHQLRDCDTSAPTRGADVTWRILREPASRGFFAVGDAAAVLDPSSSHGVLRALSTGIMAAHCIQAQLLGNARESVVMRSYNGWVHRWFTADVQRLLDLYPYPAQFRQRSERRRQLHRLEEQQLRAQQTLSDRQQQSRDE